MYCYSFVLAGSSESRINISHDLFVCNGSIYLNVIWSDRDYYTNITVYTAEQQLLATTTVYESLSTTLHLPEEFNSSYYTVSVTMYNECSEFSPENFTIHKDGKNLLINLFAILQCKRCAFTKQEYSREYILRSRSSVMYTFDADSTQHSMYIYIYIYNYAICNSGSWNK